MAAGTVISGVSGAFSLKQGETEKVYNVTAWTCEKAVAFEQYLLLGATSWMRTLPMEYSWRATATIHLSDEVNEIPEGTALTATLTVSGSPSYKVTGNCYLTRFAWNYMRRGGLPTATIEVVGDGELTEST
jgi:hypothetical protein